MQRRHGFSEEEWSDYLDGMSDGETRNRIEAHLIGCLQCWDEYDGMVAAEAGLRLGGEAARRAVSLTDVEVREGLEATLARMAGEVAAGAAESAADGTIRQRIGMLEELMAPMCGWRTARRAISLAAAESPARRVEEVTAENWLHFLRRLHSIANVMCGETGGHLVWESGQLTR